MGCPFGEHSSCVWGKRAHNTRGPPALSDAFDIAIVDGAPALEDMASSVIKASDIVLIPVQPSGADIWSAGDILELVKARQSLTGRPEAALG